MRPAELFNRSTRYDSLEHLTITRASAEFCTSLPVGEAFVAITRVSNVPNVDECFSRELKRHCEHRTGRYQRKKSRPTVTLCTAHALYVLTRAYRTKKTAYLILLYVFTTSVIVNKHRVRFWQNGTRWRHGRKRGWLFKAVK